MDRALELAGAVGKCGPAAVRAVKSVSRTSADMNSEEGLKLESKMFSQMFEGQGIEGMKAFLEKRKPEW